MPTTLPLNQLIADPAVHPRTRIRQGTIRQYAESYKEGDTLPPVDVFKSPDGRHFLGDGFHRYYGARAAGHADIAVELFEGDVREATRYACGANARHGVPRTREDKWFEVATLLSESEFAGMTDTEIAKTCRVSRQMIGKVRPHVTSKDAFHQYMKDETERRTLAREDKQIARKKAKAEAKAAPPSPPTPPPVPDRPLTPQEEAMAALARAAEAAGLARKAMAECERAYPEANRFEAMIAICEAQCQLDELVPPIDSPAAPEVSTQQMLSLLKEFGVDLQAASQPEKLHATSQGGPLPTRSVSEVNSVQSSPPQPGVVQPEKLQPEKLHAEARVPIPTGSVNEVICLPPYRQPAAEQPEKLHGGMIQPEKLHSEPALTPLDLPATRRIPPEKIAEFFAPKPVHPMIAALSEGTIRNVPEVLPIHAKVAKAQPLANPLLPRQPEKLPPDPEDHLSRRARRDRKKRRRDGPQSSRSPPAD